MNAVPQAAPATAGQAPPSYAQTAYEAFYDDTPAGRAVDWDAASNTMRAHWTAAAQAVLNRAFPGLRRQRDQARAQLAIATTALRNIALGTVRDPSVTAATALVAVRDNAPASASPDAVSRSVLRRTAVQTATPDAPGACICPRFADTGGFRVADLACPVHGVNGTDPGDGYWDEPATPDGQT